MLSQGSSAVMFCALCVHLNCSFLPMGVELLSRGCIHLKCGDVLYCRGDPDKLILIFFSFSKVTWEPIFRANLALAILPLSDT